jgi:hypothetical protein
MKKTYSIACLIIILVTSCHKGNNQTSGGTWSFKSQTYNASFCSFINGALTASTETSNPTGSLAFYFYDSTSNATLLYLLYHGDDSTTRQSFSFPPKLQSYKVTNSFPPDSGYVYVQLTDSAAYNSYQITANSTAVVTVSKAANGFLTVNLPPVEMINVNNDPYSPKSGFPSYTDSSLVSGKIIQTN